MEAAASETWHGAMWAMGLLWIIGLIYALMHAARGGSFEYWTEYLGLLCYWSGCVLAVLSVAMIRIWAVTESRENFRVLYSILTAFLAAYFWWFMGWVFLQIARGRTEESISDTFGEIWEAMKNPLNPPRQ